MRKIAACIAVAVLVPSVLTGCIRKVEEAPKETTAAVEETQEAADQAGSKTAAGTEADAGNASGTEAEAKNSSGTEADVPDAADTEADTTSSKGSTAADTTSAKGSGEVVVYNWGEYLDPDLIDQFEEDTGIKVIYEEYETNEIMYPKVVAGAATYDVICPSDYMVSKMIANDLLQPINFDHIPNIKNIGKTYMEQADGFDPGNKYAVPYVWGTIGILYNKSMIEEGDVVDSWEILWDEKYKDSILMQDSIRDCFMVPQKILGYDMNTVDEEEIKECAQLLIDQKPLVQAYVVDQARDKMIAGEAALEKTAPIRGAGSLIRRMYCLLMDNAVQYTPEGGAIRLSVAPEKKKVRIMLTNSVEQLPTEKPEKLTERFVRGDSARTQKTGGSGIGLAAVQRICEKHHGRLTIDYPDEHTFRVKVEL